jgi:hypothetical protein
MKIYRNKALYSMPMLSFCLAKRRVTGECQMMAREVRPLISAPSNGKADVRKIEPTPIVSPGKKLLAIW